MSVIATFDSIVHDTLGRLKLKPLWETYRDYAFRTLLVVVAWSAFSPDVPFNCIQTTHSAIHRTGSLTSAEAKAINSYCRMQCIPWYLSLTNYAVLGMIIITFASATYWIHMNGVKDRLNDISKFGRSILELNMSLEEMKNCSVLPISSASEETHHLFRENVQILQKYRYHSTLLKYYTLRCILCIIITAVFAFCTALMNLDAYYKLYIQNAINCSVPLSIHNPGNGNGSYVFKCMYGDAYTTTYLLRVYGLTFWVQCFCFLVALGKLWKVRKDGAEASPSLFLPFVFHTFRAGHEYPGLKRVDIRFFLTMMMGIDKQQARTIDLYADFVLDDSGFVEELKKKCGKAIVEGDMEYFMILKRSISNKDLDMDEFLQTIEDSATNVLWEGDNIAEFNLEDPKDRGDCDFDYNVFLLLSSMENLIMEPPRQGVLTEENDNPFLRRREFWTRLIKKRNWHLLFCSVCSLESGEDEYFNNVEIPLDVLDVKGKSFLFYMLRKSSMDKVLNKFKTLNDIIQKLDMDECLVHFDGKSMRAEDFFHSQYPGIYRGYPPTFRRPRTSQNVTDSVCNGESSSSSQSLSTIPTPEYMEPEPRGQYLEYHLVSETNRLLDTEQPSGPIPPLTQNEIETTNERSTSGLSLPETAGRELSGVTQLSATTSSASLSEFDANQPANEEFYISRLNEMKLTELHSAIAPVQKALEQKDWELLVTYINTLTVVYKMGNDLDPRGTLIPIRPDDHSLIRNDIFHLKDSSDLEDIFDEALKRPRNRMHFVLTAAEHILSIMEPGLRRMMIPKIEEAPLPVETREHLTRLVEKFNEQE